MNNINDWQSNVLPVDMIQCLKFRLVKSNGSTSINGIEVIHSPSAEELCAYEPRNTKRECFTSKLNQKEVIK